MRVAMATYGLLLALGTVMTTGHAQYTPTRPDLSQRSAPAPGLDRISVEERLDQRIPLDLRFRRLDGRTATLREFFAVGKPVILTFAYQSCTTVCSMVLDSVERGIHEVPWTAGQEYQVLTVSLDPNDDVARARTKRDRLLSTYGRPEAAQGWHFLFGDEATIRRLADAVGFRYFYDERQQQYGHPAAIVFLTPDGKVARYLHGLDFSTFDVRMALFEASQGRSMSTTDHILQYCYAYDPTLSTYTAKAMRVMQVGGLITLVLVSGTLLMFWRRERRRSSSQNSSSARSTKTLEVGA